MLTGSMLHYVAPYGSDMFACHYMLEPVVDPHRAVSASSGIKPLYDKYLPLPLADQFLKAFEHIRFHLPLNVKSAEILHQLLVTDTICVQSCVNITSTFGDIIRPFTIHFDSISSSYCFINNCFRYPLFTSPTANP